MTFKSRMDRILQSSFQDDSSMGQLYRQAFEAATNVTANQMAECLAKYLDGKLKGERGVTDEEMEGHLTKVIELFRLSSAKDVFEGFYKRDLAKRLLQSRTASLELERSLIAKLKMECGAVFTAKYVH